MYGEVYRKIKELFPDRKLFPYLRSVENAPHEGDFLSLYLLSASTEHPRKVEAKYQLLVARKTPSEITERDLSDFEEHVYGIAHRLSQNLPLVQCDVDFGLSDTYLYAYLRFTVRFSR